MIEKKYALPSRKQQDEWLKTFEKKQKKVWFWMWLPLIIILLGFFLGIVISEKYIKFFILLFIFSGFVSFCYIALVYRCPQCDTFPLGDGGTNLTSDGAISSQELIVPFRPEKCRRCGIFLSRSSWEVYLAKQPKHDQSPS